MTWAYDGAYLVPEAIDADMAGVSQPDDALHRGLSAATPAHHHPDPPHHPHGDHTWRTE